jgi:hypothetical protein
LRLGAVSATVGQTVEAPVEIAGVQDVAGLRFDVVYDPTVLRADGARPTNLLEGFSYSYRADSEAGLLAFAAAGARGTTETGVAVNLTFTVLAPGESVLRLENVRVVAASGADVPVSRSNGTVTVEGG